MTYKSEIGKIGEDLACDYLKSQKYKIIGRNLRQKWGELDIVAKDPGDILVFVEVKTMRSRCKIGIPTSLSENSNGASRQSGNAQNKSGNAANELRPEDNLTTAKSKKLKKAAILYAGHNQNLIDDKKGWRIDLIAITLLENRGHQLNHYENI